MLRVSKKFSLSNQHFFVGIILALFLITRIFIWQARPTAFSEITYSYMPYAHLWASGVKPYLEQLYEYPPVTIPLFYAPHLVDRATWGSFFHINYGNAYRGLILIADIGIFLLIWRTVLKTQPRRQQQLWSLIYFFAITAKAHHFIYDTIDWFFALTMFLAASAPILFANSKAYFFGWLGYWLGVGTKLVNGPLGVVYFLLELKRWRRAVFWMLLTFGIVWGLPALLFRSSLQVMLVYHNQRGLQIDSMGAVIARVADRFTKTETIQELYKNYEISGPVSDPILWTTEKLFPIILAAFIVFSWYLIVKTPTKNHHFLRLHLTLGYILTFMTFSKVLSTPFLLWHIPLVAVYPFRHFRTQLCWQLGSFLFIALCMTPLPFVEWRFIHLPTWIHVAKAILLLAGFGWWMRQSVKHTFI